MLMQMKCMAIQLICLRQSLLKMPMRSLGGAMPMVMEKSHFGNLLLVALNLVFGNQKVTNTFLISVCSRKTLGQMTSWTDTFTYGTEIAYDFTNILLKYWKSLDLDASSSLNRDEFRISYAKMALLAAHVEMDILDSDSDGIIQGNDLKTFTTLTQRAANVVLPSKFFVSRLPRCGKTVLKKTSIMIFFRN